MKQKIKFLLIAIIVTSYVACKSDSNCGNNSADFVRFSILTINEEGEEVDSSSAYNYFYSRQTVSDSAFNLQNFAFLLSPAHDTVKYIFEGINADSLVDRKDSIIMAYRKISRVDSPDCPVDFSYTDLEVVYHSFDSAVIVNRNLTLQNNAPNIKFYTSF